MTPRRALFVSYDGVLRGPGRTQTLPYVRGLAGRGHALALLTYEDPELLADRERTDAARAELGDVPWTSIPRRGRQVGDFRRGFAEVRRASREHRADFVHARGYVPAFLARVAGVPFLFDMRGFWPDERADGGLWSRKSLGYRTWKRIERSLLARAAGIVVLTQRAQEELARLEMAPQETPVAVIPTCADLARFRPVPEAERPAEARGAPRYLILGGTSTWYLPDAMLDLAARALRRRPEAHLHVLTQDAHEPLLAGLRSRGVGPERALVRAVPPDTVAGWISGAEAAIALLRSTWSKGASCPTKLGELLGCGVPILMNAGIGDADRILQHDEVGVTVTGFDDAAYDAALDQLDVLAAGGREALSARCRAVAEREFSLVLALDRYENAYATAGAART